MIRSAFIESFVTNHEVTLASPSAGEPLRFVNRFVVVVNTNDGLLTLQRLLLETPWKSRAVFLAGVRISPQKPASVP